MSSDLRQAVDDYVALRRALGYRLRGYERYLADLVADLERAGAATLTIGLAVAWATKPADAAPVQWKARLGTRAASRATSRPWTRPRRCRPPTCWRSGARDRRPTSTRPPKSRRCSRRPTR